jgi:hypothetical protein
MPTKSIGRLPWELCYWCMVILLFAWATWQRFALPLDPIADPDTWGYLSPALRKLTGAQFGHTHGRNFIYPGFVFLLLRVFGDFRAITVTQHLLGLLAGGILLLTWRRARVFVPNTRVRPPVHDALGLVATAIFLLAGEPIHFELQLRPEGVCVFLVSLNLYLVIQFVICCFIENRQTAAVAYGTAAVFSSILLGSVKPSFAVVAIGALLPLVVFFFRHGWFWQKIALGSGTAVSAALLILPEHSLSRNDKASQTFLPTTLFDVHASLICDQMADDLARDAKVPYPRDWLARVHTAFGAEIEKSRAARRPGYYPPLGSQLRKEFGSNASALCAFYWFYYLRTWRERPLLMVKKIVRQLALFYSPQFPAYNRAKILSLTDEYERGAASLDVQPYRKIWTAYPPAVEFVGRTEWLVRHAPVVQQRAYIRKSLGILAVNYVRMLLIALSLSVLVLSWKASRRRLGWLAALVLFAYSYNFLSCLEVAVIQSLENPRYKTVQMYSTLVAQLFALWFLVEFALDMRARAKAALPNIRSS